MLRTKRGFKYFAIGDGAEAVICHPSLGLGRFLFYRAVPPLSRRYEVVTYDPRGVGENQALEPDLEAWVDDVGDLMVQLGKPCHLIGVSLGTWVMARAAAHWPEGTARVILMSTTLGFPDGGESVQARRHEFESVPMSEFARQYADSTLTSFCEPEVKEQLIADLKTCDVAQYLKAMEAIYLVDNVAAFQGIQAETLVVAGAQDRRTPPAMADRVGELIQKSLVKVLPDAGHLALLDQPERVQQLSLEFLSTGSIDD